MQTCAISCPASKRTISISALLLAASILTFLVGCTDSNEPTILIASTGKDVLAVASAKGRVDIEGGVIRLAAKRDGVIARVMVEEGEQVKAGQVLAIMDDALAQSQLVLARNEVILAKLDIRKSEIALHAAKRELNRLHSLVKINAVAKRDFDQAKDLATILATELDTFKAALSVAQARSAVVENEVNEHRIVAPMDGRIIQRQASPGNGASTLNVTPLFLFAPDIPRIIRTEMDDQFLPHVYIGQPVEIMPEADPKTAIAGQVLRIGMLVGQRQAVTDDPAEKQDARVVEVVTDFDDGSLLIGQRVIVRFLSQD